MEAVSLVGSSTSAPPKYVIRENGVDGVVCDGPSPPALPPTSDPDINVHKTLSPNIRCDSKANFHVQN
ncbi:hypothetical protein J6590_093780 [Homalodisca vitripennis]|nr:hypothetical protein J6590_093780 [Homalodisca vitripennis]